MFSSSRDDAPEALMVLSARRFAVGREVLFGMFADAAELAQWWGPEEFTNTVEELDLRVGGAFRITMQGPDGKDWKNVSQFLEVMVPERIVYDHLEPVHRFTMTMTFAEDGEGTLLTWRMDFEPKVGNDKLKAFIEAANEQNFDKLEARLLARG